MIDVIRQTIMITSLVLVMMLLIEYINVISRGHWGQSLVNSKFKQLVVSAVLGLIPGCIGGFAVVSMFTHNFVNFGALTAAMIASTGDESFVMLSMFPQQALWLNLLLFVLAIGVGALVNVFAKPLSRLQPHLSHIEIHHQEFEKPQHSLKQIAENLRNISFVRAILMMGLLMFLFGVLTGQFEHAGHASHAANEHLEFGFETLLFAVLALIVLYVLLLVDQHFLEEHLWGHIIKKHFLRIALWTFGALFAIQILNNYVDINPWLQQNRLMVLFVAVLVGLIPQSGPNLVFVTLFYSGTIPFSILFANSIIQDGHSTLPLLAESKRSFLLVKGINLVVALLFGLLGFWLGW